MNTKAAYLEASEGVAKASINTSIWSFWTLSMATIVAGTVGVCAWASHSLLETFMHHVELNGIIVAITVYGIYRIYDNNFNLYQTARYVRKIEKVEENPASTTEDVDVLAAALHKEGEMIDLQNTELALRRMTKNGFFVISDNDSRLIKSKLGSRVRHKYSHPNFFAGILISFGLLGTFVGLIQTVTAVGEQMGAVSNSLATGQELSVIDLITGISQPLSGMGTAFGASLFGLGGSMLLGALNYVAGHSQDKFMENFSRWLDDRIPSPKFKALEKALEQQAASHAQAPAQHSPAPEATPNQPANNPIRNGSTNPGLSLEMGTFMVLAEDTHKQLRALGTMLSDISLALQAQKDNTAGMLAMQQKYAEHMTAFQSIQERQAEFTNLLQQQLSGLPSAGGKITDALNNLGNSQGEMNKLSRQQVESMLTQMSSIEKLLASLPDQQAKLGQSITTTLVREVPASMALSLTQSLQNMQFAVPTAPAAVADGQQKNGGLFGRMFGKA